jgi:hypothetical protein
MATGRKTGGRKKGTPNRVTSTLREGIAQAAADYDMIKKLFDDIETLDPLDRVKARIALLPYLLPRLQTISIQETTTLEDFVNMPVEERRALISELKNDE